MNRKPPMMIPMGPDTDKVWFCDPEAVIYDGVLMADWLRLCDILCGCDIRWYDSRQPTEAP